MIYKKVLTYIQDLTKEGVVIYIGEELTSLAAGSEVNGVYKVTDNNLDFISVAIGIAMVTDKRVFVVFDDNYLFRYLNKLLQASISRCNNLFFIVLATHNYSHSIKQNNLYNSVSSTKAMIYSMGFLTHVYTRFFKNKQEFKKLKKLFKRSLGPAFGIVEVDNNKKIKLIDNGNDTQLFVDFIRYRKKQLGLDSTEAIELKMKE